MRGMAIDGKFPGRDYTDFAGLGACNAPLS